MAFIINDSPALACKKYYLFSFLAVVVATHGLSLIAVSRGCSLVGASGLLIAVASLIAEHRLEARRFQ